MDPDKLTELRQWLRQSDERDFAAVVIRRRVHRPGSGAGQQRGDRLPPGRLVLEGDLRHGAGDRLGAEPAGAHAATDDVRRHGVRLHPLGAAAERPAQGEDHRQAAAQPHVGHLPGGDRRAERRDVGVRPRPQRRRADRAAGVRPGDRLRLLDARAGPRGPGVRDRHRQALRRVRHRGAVQADRDRALVVPVLRGRAKYGRHPSHGLGMPARDLARIAYCMAHGGRWEGPAGDPGVVRRGDRRADARRPRPGDAVQGQRPDLLPRLGAARAPDRRRRPERPGHPGRRPLQARLRGPADRLRAEPGPGRHPPDGRQRRVANTRSSCAGPVRRSSTRGGTRPTAAATAGRAGRPNPAAGTGKAPRHGARRQGHPLHAGRRADVPAGDQLLRRPWVRRRSSSGATSTTCNATASTGCASGRPGPRSTGTSRRWTPRAGPASRSWAGSDGWSPSATAAGWSWTSRSRAATAASGRGRPGPRGAPAGRRDARRRAEGASQLVPRPGERAGRPRCAARAGRGAQGAPRAGPAARPGAAGHGLVRRA